MLSEVPQFVSSETCLSCDGCCRFSENQSVWRPKVAPEEINSQNSCSASVLSQLDEGYAIRAIEGKSQSQCVFLNAENNHCGIHEQHPFECRLYPFLLLQKENGLALGVHLSCPYVQERRQHGAFDEHVKTLKQFFRRKEICQFLGRNQILAGEYSSFVEEIEDLFMLELKQ